MPQECKTLSGHQNFKLSLWWRTSSQPWPSADVRNEMSSEYITPLKVFWIYRKPKDVFYVGQGIVPNHPSRKPPPSWHDAQSTSLKHVLRCFGVWYCRFIERSPPFCKSKLQKEIHTRVWTTFSGFIKVN